MSEQVPNSITESNADTAPRTEALGSLLSWLDNRRNVAIAAFIFTVAVMFLYRPFSHIEDGDSALYDYMAQCIVRGQIPYRDVIDGKGPASMYLSAGAMWIGKWIGLRDLIAARLLHVLFAGVLSATAYLVADAYLRDRTAALFAFLIPLTSDRFGDWVAGGGQPKFAMIVFGMLTLLLVARDKPFWAGVCSMLGCLSWQPGLLFTGVACLIFTRYLTSWRDLRAVKLIIGAAVPLLIVMAYFQSRGALGDLRSWTFTYNYSVYAHENSRTLVDMVIHIWSVTVKIFQFDVMLIVFAIAGLAIFAAGRIREKLIGRGALKSPDQFRDAIVIAPLVYLGFCLFKFNAAPYLIPLFPFIGIYAGWALAKSACALATGRIDGRRSFLRWAPATVLFALAGMIAFRSARNALESRLRLRDQEQTFEFVAKLLGDHDKIYVHGAVELLVLLDRPNLNPYVLLDWHKDDYIAARRGVDFKAIIDEMEAQAPKVVALSRLKTVAHHAELKAWVDKKYDELELPGYDGVFVRRPD